MLSRMKSARIGYEKLASARAVEPEGWLSWVEAELLPRWSEHYRAATAWEPLLLEVELASLTYLFDAAPSLRAEKAPAADDRVVAVWGHSAAPTRPRERARLAGFLPGAERWSQRGQDRGHLIAHAAGGGLDSNLFPQARAVNRGWSPAGRRWRRLERYAARHPGSGIFVRPIYLDRGWVPAVLEHGVLTGEGLRVERVGNREAIAKA